MSHSRYERQVILSAIGQEGQSRLASSDVAIVGCGGLGAIAAAYLAGAGVGTLLLIDGDHVDRSNLHRQVLYADRNHEHGVKSELLKTRLKELNPSIKVRAFAQMLRKDNIDDCLDECDLVLECTDDIMCKYLVNDYCHMMNIPVVYGAIDRHEGYVSLFDNESEKSIHLRDIFPEPDMSIPSCSEVGVWNMIAGIIGLFQANEAMKYILGRQEVLSDQLLHYHALTNEQLKIKLRKNWTLDIKELWVKESYSGKSCQIELLEWSELLENPAEYRLISLLSEAEDQYSSQPVERIRASDWMQIQPESKSTIALYCKMGRVSQQVAQKLQNKYPQLSVYSLKGGLREYIKIQLI